MQPSSDYIPISAREIIEFTPTFFTEHAPEQRPVFQVRVPTFATRDKMGAILFQQGLIPISPEQSRAVMIDALYKIFPEGEAEDHATFLEGYWTRAELHKGAIEEWEIQEAARIFDEGMGAPKKDPTPLPVPPFTPRESARATRLSVVCLEKSAELRELQSRHSSYEAEQAALLNRLFIAGWSNIPVDVAVEGNKLTEQAVEDVRGWLQGQGAHTAWGEVTAFVNKQFGVNGGLEKNSESPPALNSKANGSNRSTTASDASDGSWTGSNTGRPPRSASRRQSGKSSGSRSGRKATTPKGGRTAGK